MAEPRVESGSEWFGGPHGHLAVLIDGDDLAFGRLRLAEADKERPASVGWGDDRVRVGSSLDAVALIASRVEKRSERVLPKVFLRVAVSCSPRCVDLSWRSERNKDSPRAHRVQVLGPSQSAREGGQRRVSPNCVRARVGFARNAVSHLSGHSTGVVTVLAVLGVVGLRLVLKTAKLGLLLAAAVLVYLSYLR